MMVAARSGHNKLTICPQEKISLQKCPQDLEIKESVPSLHSHNSCVPLFLSLPLHLTATPASLCAPAFLTFTIFHCSLPYISGLVLQFLMLMLLSIPGCAPPSLTANTPLFQCPLISAHALSCLFVSYGAFPSLTFTSDPSPIHTVPPISYNAPSSERSFPFVIMHLHLYPAVPIHAPISSPLYLN